MSHHDRDSSSEPTGPLGPSGDTADSDTDPLRILLASLLPRQDHSHSHHPPTPTRTAAQLHPSVSAADSQTTAPQTTSTAGVQLSSTTIVALGMGFIGAALLVVGITILLRMMVVNRAARQARAQGENVTFREMWRRWGGVWGLMFSAGERYPGAWEGGVVVRRRKVPPKPRMWDVDVDRLEPKEEFDLADESCQPLAAAPFYAPGSKVPECAFSVLVAMPAPPRPSTADAEAEPELPDLMLGTTHLQPSIPLADAGLKGDPDASSDKDVEIEYVYPHELTLMRTRTHPHWATVWGIDAGTRIA